MVNYSEVVRDDDENFLNGPVQTPGIVSFFQRSNNYDLSLALLFYTCNPLLVTSGTHIIHTHERLNAPAVAFTVITDNIKIME